MLLGPLEMTVQLGLLELIEPLVPLKLYGLLMQLDLPAPYVLPWRHKQQLLFHFQHQRNRSLLRAVTRGH